MKNRILLTSALSSALFFAFTAMSSAAIQGSIKIEQLSASDIGTWTILSEDGSAIKSTDPGVDKTNYAFAITQFGQTTFSVAPPAGMSARINVYRGGEQIATVDSQQYSFKLVSNDNYRFVVQYSLSKLGSLGVTSEPSGIRFRMRGPNGRNYSARTPHTFNNLPAGSYALTFAATETCFQPSRKTVVVEPEQRNTTHVTLTCTDNTQDETVDRSRISKRALREYAEQREFNARGNRK